MIIIPRSYRKSFGCIIQCIIIYDHAVQLLGNVGSDWSEEEDREVLRRDLVSLFGWSQDWQMLFNLDKCVVMHFGFNNIGESMELGGK